METRAIVLLVLAAAMAGCISEVEAPLQRDALSPDRSVVLFVFPSPGPIMDETNSNVEQAAKVIPGLGFIYGAGESQRNLDASRQLGEKLPAWPFAASFETALRSELANNGIPNHLLSASDGSIADADKDRFNSADNIIDWQRRYLIPQPDNDPTPPRAYSMIAGLRDSVILEVNIAYGAPSDGKGQWTPVLSFVAKLVRGSDNALLWRHEDQVQDPGGLKPEQAYLSQPTDLINRYQALVPALAHAVATGLQKSLREASNPSAYSPGSPPPGH